MQSKVKIPGAGLLRTIGVLIYLAIASIQLFGIMSLVSKLTSNRGNFYVNVVLLTVSVIYFVISVIFCFVKVKGKTKKQVKTISKKTKKYTKLAGNTYNLGLAAYNITLAATTGGFEIIFDVIGCIGQGIGIVISILFEIIGILVNRRIKKFSEGLFTLPGKAANAVKETIGNIGKKPELANGEKQKKPGLLDKLIARSDKKHETREEKKALKQAKQAALTEPEEKKKISVFGKSKVTKSAENKENIRNDAAEDTESNQEVKRLLAEADVKRAEAEAIKAQTEKIKAEAKAIADAERELAKAQAEAKRASEEKTRAEARIKADKERAEAEKARAEAKSKLEAERSEAKARTEAERAEARAKAEEAKKEARLKAEQKKEDAKKAKAQKAAEAEAKSSSVSENKKGTGINIKLPDISGIVKSAESMIKAMGAKRSESYKAQASETNKEQLEAAAEKSTTLEGAVEEKDTASV